MHLTLRQLQVFAAVAEHASFSKAAAELHLTQPAVSIQVKHLEESIGLPLFERIGKKLFLTEAGSELRYYSQSIAQQLDDAREVFAQLKDASRGQLRVAVATTANSFASHLLAAFSRLYPNAVLSLDVTNRTSLIRQLRNNETDMVIMGRPPAELELVGEPFMDNPLVVIAAPDHPLAAGDRRLRLNAITDERFVVRETGSGTRAAMQRFLTEHGLDITIGMEMTSNEALKQAVAAGLGLGVTSRHTLQPELQAGQLVELDVAHFPIVRQWFVVHRQGKRLSPIAQAFRQFVIDEAANVWPTIAAGS
ncbi:LysR family transcriptional regulator [Salinisphaera sp. P385]|uniref:LysR family transcriptional regulator n=1 Tax=Spectribacter acetivorans TaxID=3075603 RepID=A0ABU3BBL5_9GAMM|nr:LysR family transcriptional regulator [Salinisphaera sp. P385]MDT0619485.1 LysR family transcriptional regulator [Salinisphaera sp. P385]